MKKDQSNIHSSPLKAVATVLFLKQNDQNADCAEQRAHQSELILFEHRGGVGLITLGLLIGGEAA